MAAKIESVEFSNLSLKPESPIIEPHHAWEAKFNFRIPESYTVKKDDYFELVLPRVYRIKFTEDSTELIIPMKDRLQPEVFHCTIPQQAAFKYADTILRCTTLIDLAPHPEIYGEIKIVLSFSNGDSCYEYELENANYFESGMNYIELEEGLNTEVHFNAAQFSGAFYSTMKTTSYDSVETYFLSMNCPNGYILGGTQRINFDSKDQNCNLDCDSPQVFISNHFNDWWFPKSYQEAKDVDVNCFGNELIITIGEQPDGHLLWINAMQGVEEGINTLFHSVYLEYTCTDTLAHTTHSTQHYANVDYIVYEVSDTAIAEVPVSVPSNPPSTTPISSHSISTITSVICPHCSEKSTNSSSIVTTTSSTIPSIPSSITFLTSSSHTVSIPTVPSENINSTIITTISSTESSVSSITPPTETPISYLHSSSEPITTKSSESVSSLSVNLTTTPPISIKPSLTTSTNHITSSFISSISSTSNSSLSVPNSESSLVITTSLTVPFISTSLPTVTTDSTYPPIVPESSTSFLECLSCSDIQPPTEFESIPMTTNNVPSITSSPSSNLILKTTTSIIIPIKPTTPDVGNSVTVPTIINSVGTFNKQPPTSSPTLSHLPPFSLQVNSRPPIDTRSITPTTSIISYQGYAATIKNNLGLGYIFLLLLSL